MISHIRRVHQSADIAQDVKARIDALKRAEPEPQPRVDTVAVAHPVHEVTPFVVAHAAQDFLPLVVDDHPSDPTWHGGLASPAASTSSSTHEFEDFDRRRTKRSTVWDVFVRVNGEVQCTLCDVKLKFCSSTSNMMYHLRTKHPGTLSEGGQAEASVGGVTTVLICRMIERDLLPVSTVDGEGFRELLAHLTPGYSVPSSGDIGQLVEGRVRDMTEVIAAQLGNVDKVALTADTWSTTLPGLKYLTVCCSFITEDWCQKSVVLQTHQLPLGSRANPGAAAQHLFHTIKAWSLTGKVAMCVRNDANGWDLSPWDHAPLNYLQCFASTLQQAVHNGLDGANLLCVVAAAGRLAKHFNSNPAAKEALELKQLQMCLPHRRLVRSSRTKWATVCDMFECLLEQRWAIKAVLSDHAVTSQAEVQALAIEDECWRTMESFTPVLSTLRWAAAVISADAEVSISNVYPITFSLIQLHLVPKESDLELVAEFKRRVRATLIRDMEVGAFGLRSSDLDLDGPKLAYFTKSIYKKSPKWKLLMET